MHEAPPAKCSQAQLNRYFIEFIEPIVQQFKEVREHLMQGAYIKAYAQVDEVIKELATFTTEIKSL
jgi:hypothetical protein